MAVTIAAVAERAKVAASTVSLVLRNRPRVSQETRDNVLAAVRELGYQKRRPGRPRRRPGDPVSAKRTNRLALLVPDMTPAKLYAPIYADVVRGVENSIHEARKTMVLRHVESGKPVGGAFLFTRLDGVLLFGETHDPELIRQLNGIPVVQLMHAAHPNERWDRVTYDNTRLGVMAAQYLQSRGHRYAAFIGHICGRDDIALQQRGIDFKAVMSADGGHVHLMIRDLLHVTDRIHTVHRGVMDSIVDEMLEFSPRPTAVFTEADMVAQALYPALQARGIRPGRDFDVISCNNERPLLAALRPRPATLDIHAGEIGRRAVQRLLWRIHNPDQPVETILIEPSLVEAESLDEVNPGEPGAESQGVEREAGPK
jgi:DNA-binding LacI/PurR family transcriptional regulator